MKRMLLFCCYLFFIWSGYGQGQVYPVQATVNLVPPYSLYLSDYVSGSRERLHVTLLNRDVQYQSMPVRLRLTVKGSGFSMQTRPYASVPQITLEPNVPYKLTIDDLLPYFDTRNLSAQGLGGDSYLKGGRLPEGMMEFGIEVLEYGTSKLLSQRAAGTAWLSLQKPPLLSLPYQEEVIPWREPLNLLFQWTPQHSGVARVEYELVIKELWDNGLAPESAFAYSPEIFHERITSTSFLYGALAPPLQPGRRYAWAVRVVAKDGADDVNIFENEGMSMIRSFRIARYCPEPVQVKATAERGYINVEWESAPEHIEYAVAYRLKGSEEWSEVRSSFPSAMLPGIRPGNTYEYRVAGFCEPAVPTFGKIGSLSMPSEDTARLRNCGILRPVDLSNQEPLEELLDGDRFMAGDFPVYVQEVTGSQGFFTGTGYVHVPFLAFAPFKVTFDNVYINTDRRLVRGVVRTVYDPTESGMANLDDIFTGGSNTGKVVEGITKTDLSADFAIDENNDFYFDASSGNIEMTDGSGEVIGYIDVGNIVTEDGSAGGDNGNEPSVFPMTVKDSEGNIYQLEEAPVEDNVPDVPPGAGETPSSAPKKKLVVKPLGKSGDSLEKDNVNFKRLDQEIARVEFTDTEGSLYAFDSWKSVYSQSYLIRPKYEQIGQDYHVAAKLVPSGKTDKVGAVITVNDPSVDPSKVVFKTRAGTEFRADRFDASTGRYVLSVVGGKANDGQGLYALYPRAGGGYYNLGKLLVVSYPEYRIRVKVVPVANDLTEFDGLRRELQRIYSRVGIECVVEKMPVFDYDAPFLFKEKSGVFNAYNDEMKKLNAAYASENSIDPETSYLFVLLYGGQKGDRNYSGFMPLDKQFGYLFRRDFNNFEEFAVAAAHELAHGRLSLRHPFDKSLGLPEGSVPDNLMDYANGRELAKWQWDVIYDPGVVVRIFERDGDAAIKVNLKIDRGNYNIAGYDEILSYLLNRKQNDLVNNLQEYAYNTTISDDEKNQVASLIVKRVLPGVEIGDEVEARAMIEEFIINYSVRQISTVHEQIMEALQNSNIFPESDIREKIDKTLGNTISVLSIVDNYIKTYEEIWKSFKLASSLGIDELKRQIFTEKTIIWTKQGLCNAMQYLSNSQFKNLLRSKLPSITNKEVQELVVMKNNPQSSTAFTKKLSDIVDKLGTKDIENITQGLDDISLALLAGQKLNFNILNTTAEKILLKLSDFSQKGGFEKAGVMLGYIVLLKKAEVNERIMPADLLGAFPNTVALFSFLVEWIIDDKIQEMNELIFEEAPDWSIVKNWNINFRGRDGFPADALYMYYTDEKERTNPEKIPTSFVVPQSLAFEIFGFSPKVVNFDSKSMIKGNEKGVYFLPTKQVNFVN